MYFPAICFFCSALFVKRIQGDVLEMLLGPAATLPWPKSDFGLSYRGRSVPAQITSWDNQPAQAQTFSFPLCHSRADMHGHPAWKFKRINASITGAQEPGDVQPAVCPSFSRGQFQRHSAYERDFSGGPSRTEPQQNP